MIMKTLQNNFTTLQQSKRLLELGVPADSADCIFTRYSKDEKWKRRFIEDVVGEQLFCNQDFYFPCWSVGRLIEIGNICSIPKIKEAGFHLLAQDFDDLIETMIISMKMKVEHGWIDFSKLEK